MSYWDYEDKIKRPWQCPRCGKMNPYWSWHCLHCGWPRGRVAVEDEPRG